MREIRVCIVIPDSTICSGVNSQALQLAQRLEKLGARVIMVFALNTSGSLSRPCYDKSFEERLKASGITYYHKPKTITSLWESYRYYLKLFFKLRRQYEAVYINGVSAMVCWFVLFFKLLGKKVIIKMTGININDPATLKMKMPGFLLKMLNLSDRFIGTSTELCQAFRTSSVFCESKLVQIPNGVDTDLFSPLRKAADKKKLREKLELPLEDKIVTYVGSVRRGKGIDLIFECWEHVIAKHPDASLLVVGPLCPICPTVRVHDREFIELLKKKVGIYLIEEDKLIKMLILNKPKNKIHMLGTKSNIHEYLQASDVFLFLSRSEGMPNALMEAMSSALPCVTLNIGEVCKDLITDNELGRAVPDRDSAALQQAISSLLTSPEKRAKMGAAAREKIQKEFTIEEISRRHFELYQELLKS